MQDFNYFALSQQNSDLFLGFQEEIIYDFQKRQLQNLPNAGGCLQSTDCASGCCLMGVCQAQDDCPSSLKPIWIVLIVVLLILVFIVPTIIYCYRRNKRRRRLLQSQRNAQTTQANVVPTAANNSNINDSALVINGKMDADTTVNANVSMVPNVPDNKNTAKNNNNLIAVMIVNNPSIGNLEGRSSASADEEENEEERPYTFPRSMYLTPQDANKEMVLGRPADENAKLPEGVEKEEDHIKKMTGESTSITQLPGQVATTREKRMKSFDVSKFDYGNEPEQEKDVEEEKPQAEENKVSTKPEEGQEKGDKSA